MQAPTQTTPGLEQSPSPEVPVAQQAPRGRRLPGPVVMVVGVRSAAVAAPVVRVARRRTRSVVPRPVASAVTAGPLGSPAKVARELSDEEVARLRAAAEIYFQRWQLYVKQLRRIS